MGDVHQRNPWVMALGGMLVDGLRVVRFPDVGCANFHLCFGDNPSRGFPLRGGQLART
jgi:hypothetical protein